MSNPFVDIRPLAPSDRHRTVMKLFESLDVGKAFEVVNDHDSKPLMYQMKSITSETFSWDYLEEGPKNWRIRITKVSGKKQSIEEKEEGCCGICGSHEE